MRRNVLFLSLALACSNKSSDKPNPSPGDPSPDSGSGTVGSGGSTGSGGSGSGGNSGSGGIATGAGGKAEGGAPGKGGSDTVTDRDSGSGDMQGASAQGGSPMTPAPTGNPYVYVGGYDQTISILQLDMATGTLMQKGTATGAGNAPTYLAFSPDKKFLFAINEASGPASKVTGFAVSATDGALTKINDAPTGGDGSPHLSVHPSGKLVMVAHYGSGHVSSLKVDGKGQLDMAPADIQRPAMKTSHQIISDKTGAYAFVCNVNANTIFQYKIDSATGKFSDNDSVTGFPAGAGPRHLAFHPSKPWAYTINETATSVSSLTYDAATGKLSAPKTITSLPAAVAASPSFSGAHVLVHPSGKFVFSSNRGHNSISVFAVDGTDGHLTFASNETAAGEIMTPRDFGMDATGKYLVVASQMGAKVSVLQIDQATGKLTPKSNLTTPKQPAFVGIVYLP